jgi:hypothetical protein
MIRPIIDPYNGATPLLADGSPVAAFRHSWRQGPPLDRLYPDGPFALCVTIGRYDLSRSFRRGLASAAARRPAT